MNPVALRRIAIAGLILTLLVAIDGIYMVVTNYNPDDTSGHMSHLSDGATVLIAAALLLIITVVAFVLSQRTQPGQVSVPQPAAITEAEGQE
ncbi:hypothetical protein [Ktedonobacter racemifer]|uniref:Uncharacterized protein n=1 Tax=Ktedonobacter racemifer DSM 44963 TaxID=485913 RepID=D6U410_KTERA|nr:hypothetical protein [Ktedonobacter racemifer]EFH81248.1 hypothetical protein Krac_1954 [Ktedonobacter racemifer DSM 44963]